MQVFGPDVNCEPGPKPIEVLECSRSITLFKSSEHIVEDHVNRFMIIAKLVRI
jgi:hypothetical protein